MADKILVQGTVLLITSLFGIVSGLIVYIWISSRRDNDHKMNKMEKCIESHNERIIVIETNCKKCKDKKK
jgi:heme/copper-type cytochrome/quinol oxidase subunit 2